MKKIIVHDDESDPLKRYTEELNDLSSVRKDFEVIPLSKDEFSNEMNRLTERRLALRTPKTNAYPNESRLDDADIVIVDWDLVKSIPNANWNSEMVAYLARCFSDCGLIIGLNLPTCFEFDLTLRGNLGSYADLNIVSKQLHNERLWDNDGEGHFRPWYWPTVPDYLTAFAQRTRDVKDHFDEPICEILGLEDVAKTFAPSVAEFLGKRPLQTTFEQFVTDSRQGLQGKDANAILDCRCRIAAARISKWLERRVLPGQNILVDAPHLVSRFPSLLEKPDEGIDAFDMTTMFDSYRGLGLRYSRIEGFRFQRSYWLSRPAWFWRQLSEFDRVEEVSKPWQKHAAKYAFCEDASKFYSKSLCKQFRANVDSPYNRRYVRVFSNVDYAPRVRFVL